jgi:hypothetical protein
MRLRPATCCSRRNVFALSLLPPPWEDAEDRSFKLLQDEAAQLRAKSLHVG